MTVSPSGSNSGTTAPQQGANSNITTAPQQGTNSSTPPPQGYNSGGINKKSSRYQPQRISSWTRAYWGSLVVTSAAFPIFASGATVCFYLAPSFALPFLPQPDSSWHAPVYGFLVTCIALFLFAALRIRLATAWGANMHVYEVLKNRYSELKARLGMTDIIYGQGTEEDIIKIQKVFSIDEDNQYTVEASRKVYEAYYDLDQCLNCNNSGIEWASGAGYTSMWRMVHRAQEALVEIETPQEVISEVIHDVRSIQNSAMGDNKALIRKMLQAAKDICPEAMAYFEELQSDKNYIDLFDNNTGNQPSQPAQPARSKEMAREAIRQVKHTLNSYQDNLRETLVRIRNRVLASIALTGFVTYLLLCIMILRGTTTSIIGTATTYYMVGAIAGLFVRFYNEANNKEAPEDYGLFSSRLVATVLLSGLAGIGGVLVTTTISTLGQNVVDPLTRIFTNSPTIDYLIEAAIFGYAPNLIIGTLQQKAQKYSTDLQNSKGEGTGKEE